MLQDCGLGLNALEYRVRIPLLVSSDHLKAVEALASAVEMELPMSAGLGWRRRSCHAVVDFVLNHRRSCRCRTLNWRRDLFAAGKDWAALLEGSSTSIAAAVGTRTTWTPIAESKWLGLGVVATWARPVQTLDCADVAALKEKLIRAGIDRASV